VPSDGRFCGDVSRRLAQCNSASPTGAAVPAPAEASRDPALIPAPGILTLAPADTRPPAPDCSDDKLAAYRQPAQGVEPVRFPRPGRAVAADRALLSSLTTLDLY
jgi:hypothetical protein